MYTKNLYKWASDKHKDIDENIASKQLKITFFLTETKLVGVALYRFDCIWNLNHT